MNIKDKTTRVNKGITSPEIRLVDQEGNQVGVVTLEDALYRAEIADLDLVEISPNAEPPVCRIMNYGKYVFEKNKKKHAEKKKQQRTQLKEVKFRPRTDVGDYNVKVRSMIRFLEDGDKVKITVRFRGRELMHPDLGMALLKKIETDILQHGTVEQQPKFEGKQIVMVLAPKR